MKHLILPIASSTHEGAHQSAPVIPNVELDDLDRDLDAHREFIQRHNWRLEREMQRERDRAEHQRWLERNAGAGELREILRMGEFLL